MNRINLTGRLTKDPELSYTPGSGAAVTKITLAVDDYDRKTKQKTAQFIPVTVWGKQAENLAQYMSKGSQLSVTGKLRTYSYDAKDGTKRYGFEVVADMYNGIEFLSKSNGAREGQPNNTKYTNNYNNGGFNNQNQGNQNAGGFNNNGYNNSGLASGGYNGGYNGGYSQPNNNIQSPVESDPFAGAFGGFGDDFTPIDDGDVPF